VIIQVDSTGPVPVYEQIREQITRMVVTGTIAPNTRLPTIRQLANDLRLARGTVAKAYGMLETNAVIETRGHRGSYTLAPSRPVSTGEAHASADEQATVLLSAAAETYGIVARQLGRDLDAAQKALADEWARIATDGPPVQPNR